MGADLCGYILVGPKVLSKASILKAKKHSRGVISRAKKFAALGDDKALAAVENDAELSNTLDAFGDGVDGLKQLAGMDAVAIVNDAVAAWCGNYRDWMDRALPSNPSMKIGVCGEMTWGDGPQEGSAWHAMDLACRMGVLDVLGIK